MGAEGPDGGVGFDGEGEVRPRLAAVAGAEDGAGASGGEVAEAEEDGVGVAVLDGDAAGVVEGEDFAGEGAVPGVAVVLGGEGAVVDDDDDGFGGAGDDGEAVDVFVGDGAVDVVPCLAAVAAVSDAVDFDAGPDALLVVGVDGEPVKRGTPTFGQVSATWTGSFCQVWARSVDLKRAAGVGVPVPA